MNHSQSRFNRQSFPEIEEHIEAVWRDRVTKEPWLFNGAKFRLHSAVLSASPHPTNGPEGSIDAQCTSLEKGHLGELAVHNPLRKHRPSDKSAKEEQSLVLKLQLGVTCYKDYLGTNWSQKAEELQRRGETERVDPQAFLAQPLGVGAVVATSDGEIVLLRRSQKVAEAAGLLDIPGGHPEPKVGSKCLCDCKICPHCTNIFMCLQMVCQGVSEEMISVDHLLGKERAIVSEIFSSVCAEISDEVCMSSKRHFILVLMFASSYSCFR